MAGLATVIKPMFLMFSAIPDFIPLVSVSMMDIRNTGKEQLYTVVMFLFTHTVPLIFICGHSTTVTI